MTDKTGGNVTIGRYAATREKTARLTCVARLLACQCFPSQTMNLMSPSYFVVIELKLT